jgi:isoquinoline 1-oxidoreductase subunit alpha
MPLALQVNGTQHTLDVPEDMPLLWVLRDRLGMLGTRYGCGAAQCGACTVLVDGVATRSCVTPVGALADQSVRTIEASDSAIEQAVKQAWIDLAVAQCGYCQSGQIMSAAALLQSNANPSDADIDAAMQGNLCRCATYQRIRQGIHTAASAMRTQS